MTNGMRYTVTEKQRKLMEKISRKFRRRSWWYRTKRKILLPFLKLTPAKNIVWAEGYGGRYPACPRCGEYVYYADTCCFCGQRLRDGQTIGQVLEEHER